MSYNIPVSLLSIDSSGHLTVASQGTSDYTGIAAPSLSGASHGKIYFDSSTSIFKVSQNGSAYVPMLSSLNPSNLLVNGGFERWSLATSVNLSSASTLQFTDGWFMEKYDGTGVTFSQETTITDSSPSSLKYQTSSTGGFLFQPIANFADYAGKTVSFSARYRPAVTNAANEVIACGIWDGVNLTFGNSLDNSTTAWRTTSGSATVAANPTCLYFIIAGNAGSGSLQGLTLFGFPINSPIYFDNAILVEGSTLPASYEPDDGRASNITPVVLGYNQLLGGLTLQQLATPSAPVIVSSNPGSTSYSYKIVAVLPDGSTTPASAAGTIATGNATLNFSNANTITWTPVPGAVYYNVYRTASAGTPSSTGLIGGPGTTYWFDSGIAGDSTTPPTINTTGQIHAAFGIVAKTTTYTILSTDNTILANATGGAFAVTLPSVSANLGRIFIIKKTDSSGNAVTVTPASGTIDGAGTVSLTTQYQFTMVQSDGTNWWVV